MPTKSTTAKTGKRSDRTLIGVAGGTCMVASLIVSPLAGLAIGLAVAALLLASRGRMPTMSEGVKMFAALVLIAAFLVVLEGWGEVKEGVAEVFRRVWPR